VEGVPDEPVKWPDKSGREVTFYPFLVITEGKGERVAWLPYWHVVRGKGVQQKKYGQWARSTDLSKRTRNVAITSCVQEPLGPSARGAAGQPAFVRLDEVERAHTRRVLEACDWKIDGTGHAAAELGLNPSHAALRMRKLGMRRPARPAEPGR
jgi:hypothetical protein